VDVYRIEWSDALSIGDPEIDAQHRQLIERIAKVPDQAGPGDALLLAEALEYAAVHFKAEETYMERVGYPGFAAHRSDHKFLTRTLQVYKQRYEDGETDLHALKQFLFRWVRDHIMDEDRKIGIYIASQGDD
jgi:hemerythrin